VIRAALEYFRHEPFDHTQHVVQVDKRHFHIELGKLRLAVGALVFIRRQRAI